MLTGHLPLGAAVTHRRTSWHFAWVGFACLVLAAAVRLPFLGAVGEDEAFFAIVAHRWLAGVAPYAGSFDVKPPGLFAVYALADAAFGFETIAMKLLLIACVGATSWGLWLIGERHLSRRVGLFAAALYPLYSLTQSGTTASSELIEVLPEVFAALLVLDANRRSGRRLVRVAAAGLLLGVAATVRQGAVLPAIFMLVALAIHWRGPRVKLIASFVAGGAMAPLAFAGLYAAHGHLMPFLTDAVCSAAARMRGDNIGFAAGMLRFFPAMKPFGVLQIGALFLFTRAATVWRGPYAAGASVIVAWMIGAAFGVIAVRSMYDHYFLALVPSLLLASGVAIFHIVGAGGAAGDGRSDAWNVRLLCRALAVAAAAAWPLALDRAAITAGSDLDAAAAVARAIDRAGIAPDAAILVVNRGLPIYLAADRLPRGRYFHPQHLLCDFPAPDADPLGIALRERPAVLVVADEATRMVCERDDRHAELHAAISAYYCRADHIIGRSDSFDIFVDRRAYPAVCDEA
jgi:hypothetical protein